MFQQTAASANCILVQQAKKQDWKCGRLNPAQLRVCRSSACSIAAAAKWEIRLDIDSAEFRPTIDTCLEALRWRARIRKQHHHGFCEGFWYPHAVEIPWTSGPVRHGFGSTGNRPSRVCYFTPRICNPPSAHSVRLDGRARVFRIWVQSLAFVFEMLAHSFRAVTQPMP